MRALRTLFLVGVCLGATSLPAAISRAGDPCPIDFRVTNLGSLYWSKGKAPKQDKVLAALLAHAKVQECSAVSTRTAKDSSISLSGKAYIDVGTIQDQLVDKKKSFRCTDAHEALKPLRGVVGEDGNWPSADVYYQRGCRRVLVTVLGWKTVCASIQELEDPKTGGGKIAELWAQVTKEVVADRHENP